MRIDSRGTVTSYLTGGSPKTFTAAAAVAYCVDRFYAGCTGANVVGARVAGSGADQFIYQFTGAASVTGIIFGQRIEATNIWDLASNNITFSVVLSNSLLTTVTWRAYYANSSDTFSAKTQIATGTFTVNNTPTRYNAQITLPTQAINGICIELSVGNQTSGIWKIGAFQVEAGSIMTAFDRRPYQIELGMCERYARWIPILMDGVGLANEFYGSMVYFSRMRATPTAGSTGLDPETASQQASNMISGSVERTTPYSCEVMFQVLGNGAFRMWGRRAYLDAEL
jgi:hypothetical protein